MKVVNCILFSLCFLSGAFAQLVETPIAHHPPRAASFNHSGRVQASPLNLPFWDDFSYSDSLTYPQENLWQFGKSVFLNNGVGILPPSKNVATFDGVDSLGKPYNINDVLAKGYADKLVSQPIRMDLVDPALRSTVYLSFFYQIQGRGESPDDGDQLSVSLKNSSGIWETVYTLGNSITLDPNLFYQVLLPISDSKFFHNDFQFRIRNFARLSGPYDTWNVDYIYLNTGRSPADTSYPDRTVSSPLNSMFQDYYAIPIKHFFQNPSANLKRPSLYLYNLRVGNLQPFDYNTEAVFTTKIGTTISTSTVVLDVAQDPGALLTGLQYLNLTLNKIPPASAFNVLADSIGIKFKFKMATKDNVLQPPADNGDYDPAKYSPIDFRVNDLVQTKYTLASYYAYDDGTAEYGAGLNQAGSYLAFKFPMKFTLQDTLIAVDIYFPEFGDNTSQSLRLQIRSDLTDSPTSLLYEQVIQVNRNTQSRFNRYKLDKFVRISNAVYIGWKQLTTVSIPVGLDKNTDNGDKIYYNTNGAWIQNTTVKGSIMVRPVFGRGIGEGVTTGLPEEPVAHIYPNPASRICYLPAEAENISVFDITGRKIEIEKEPLIDRTGVSFLSPVSGLVIVHYFLSGRLHAEKIMVRAE